ncbi:HD family phosphohydrolase [Christiangramia flava]|uniref:Membrane protein containing HD superfamily hydrolase domain n=1 Tax=Christiangramia flava JLT2011 TaxID=1229726 RepID=A0A1L7I8I5_9FLAO|nr:HDIG domain-containing metalloprotein [Christiangramia flava]APU69921.1 Membrane protein containing HD superfamily hydrolase domain [Christiangramia flava JLT2011]OSS39406.1 HD superfamily hydrolase domain containing membrane protein [Christiangramia flava JLT2011]
MSDFINKLYKNQALFYKIFLFVLTSILIVYLLPKGGKFKYDIPKGKPWQYENLYAPFDFAILKTDEEVAAEKQAIRDSHIPYYDYDQKIPDRVKEEALQEVHTVFPDSTLSIYENIIDNFVNKTLTEIYQFGLLKESDRLDPDQLIYLLKGNEATEVAYRKIFKQGAIRSFLSDEIEKAGFQSFKTELLEVFFNSIEPNVTFNNEFTQKELESKLNNISYTRGIIEQGSRIIAKGEVVEGNKYNILQSLKAEYESQVWSQSNYNWIIFGYSILVCLALLMLLLFMKKYRFSIFENNVKVTFIFFNIIFMVMLTKLVVNFKIDYVYVVPLCILPLTLKAFFDARLGLFTHVITVLLLGFIVPNSYEYMFLQIIAGIVTILTVSELYKRANLFISVGQITLVYIISYFAFIVIQEGEIETLKAEVFLTFLLGGLATLFVQPLIYVYEKIFGLVSDMSLLELSDTNSRLLKELAEKAPGTFHHSLNVANLAEAAANEIHANSMLARVGALYHDIGKMHNPTYFTENQTTSVNSHDELSPRESAQIIIEHVIKGIEIAKRNNLPDRVIDFIRTHHGTSTVYYFYKKEKEINENASAEDFRYPGPIPFSKETAILMMCDSVEAASKSLKEPTSVLIDNFVEKIIDKQMDEGQFLNSNITFKEIQMVKKILKRKLKNIYHLRIEYPE